MGVSRWAGLADHRVDDAVNAAGRIDAGLEGDLKF